MDALNLQNGTRREKRLAELAADLRTGRKVTDFRFDEVFPGKLRELSRVHWTPVEVVIRATELLQATRGKRILDVGSGCGKFCIVGALASAAEFFGVEQRPHLVDAAREAARSLGADRAWFTHANMVDLDWSGFDGFYLFNPFYENTERTIRIDDTLSLNSTKFELYVEAVKAKLRSVRAGIRVVTYHGFGGDIPPGFRLERDEPCGTSFLKVWLKVS